MTHYTAEFATFYDRYLTTWVREYSPRLADLLDRTCAAERSVVDLCCGTGVTAEVLLDRGWRVVGVDGSAGMLALAERRLAGRATLVRADAVDFRVPGAFGACVSVNGALNHLETAADLARCFTSVHRALAPGGQFVFDLFEGPHFRQWNDISVLDRPDALTVRRGVWDDREESGALRVSGTVEERSAGSGWLRVEQNLRAVLHRPDRVLDALTAAGFALADHDIEESYLHCGSCDQSCRTVYRAIKEG